jgi:hypothetical protein
VVWLVSHLKAKCSATNATLGLPSSRELNETLCAAVLLGIPQVDGRGRCLVSAVLLSVPSRGIEFSACRTCTGSWPAASSSSAEYVVNVFLTSSRRSS